mmetsp:Transcript_124396/g.387280  ORF Transcript_124396/g.387280 Transcript_124396/m.387280 type:complete len:198 (-) Transcript_124396:22-615(-)
MKAIFNTPSALRDFPDMQTDYTFLMSLVRRNGLALAYLFVKWQDCYELVEQAIDQNPLALAHASLRLRQDRGLVMKAVTCNAEALRHADLVCRCDRDVISAAMKRSFLALRHVPREICWQPQFFDVIADHAEFPDYDNLRRSIGKKKWRNLSKEDQHMYAVVEHIAEQLQAVRRARAVAIQAACSGQQQRVQPSQPW